jgi:TonB family protein
MRLLTTLFILFACSWSYTVEAQPADGWLDVSPKNEQFTIQMPSDPTAKTQQANFEQFKVEGRIYDVTSDGVDYTVWSLDNKGFNSNVMDKDAYLDRCADVVWESLLKPRRDQIPKEPGLVSQMTYHGELSKVVPGREYLIVLGNKPGLARFYLGETQLYVLTALNAEPESAGTQRFISSFRLKISGMQEAASLQEDSSAVARAGAPSPSGSGSGTAVGPGAPTATIAPPQVLPPSATVGKGGGIGPGSGNMGGGDRKLDPGKDYDTVFSGRDVTVKARVLAKPEPSYTESARKYAVQGTVVLRGIFSSSGEVKSLVARTKLPHGLTQEALRAARKITFTPAQKDGRAVSMYIQLEYNFNLY